MSDYFEDFDLDAILRAEVGATKPNRQQDLSRKRSLLASKRPRDRLGRLLPGKIDPESGEFVPQDDTSRDGTVEP